MINKTFLISPCFLHLLLCTQLQSMHFWSVKLQKFALQIIWLDYLLPDLLEFINSFRSSSFFSSSILYSLKSLTFGKCTMFFFFITFLLIVIPFYVDDKLNGSSLEVSRSIKYFCMIGWPLKWLTDSYVVKYVILFSK